MPKAAPFRPVIHRLNRGEIMKNYCITFRSVTFGQKGERMLKRQGINCYLRRTPKNLTNRECGYCLQIRPGDIERSVDLLQGQVPFGKVYAMDYDGGYEEWVR